MVGRVDDAVDLRNGVDDRDLDALAKRDIDLGAALAAAAQLDIGGAVAHLEQVDVAAMGRNRRIDLPVEDFLDPCGHRVAPAVVRVLDMERATHDRRVKADDRAIQVWARGWIDQQPESLVVNDQVVGGRVLRRHEIELIEKAATPATGDRDPQACVRTARFRAHGVDLRDRGGCHRDRGRHWLILFVVN